MHALRMVDIRLDHPGRPGALKGISLSLYPGEALVVEGRSGSGKSSLLHVAAGLLAPSSGEVALMGQVLDPKHADSRSHLRGKYAGLVFQHLHLLAELTVAENVELPLRLARFPRAESRERVADLLEQFGLGGLSHRRPPTLSGGEQQRVAIARALAKRPGLLLVDEPTSNLDTANALQVVEALRRASRSGAAVLVATHDELLRRLGRVVRIEEGRLGARA